MLRALKPGWQRIGPMCRAHRRSLWLLTERDLTDRVLAFEICGGREGDDLHYRFEQQDSPRFADLLEIAQAAAKSRVDGHLVEDTRYDFLDHGLFRVGPSPSPFSVYARILRTTPSPELARYRARGGEGAIVDLGEGIKCIEFWCMGQLLCLFEPEEAVFSAVVNIVSMALTCRNS